MDDADRVAEKQAFQSQVNVYQSKRDELSAQAIGKCLFCEEVINEKGRRWCDAECRDSWERGDIYE